MPLPSYYYLSLNYLNPSAFDVDVWYVGSLQTKSYALTYFYRSVQVS